MNRSATSIEGGQESLKDALISGLVRPIHPMSDKVRELHQPAGGAVNEQWNLGVGSHRANRSTRRRPLLPPRAHEVLKQRLDPASIRDRDAPMKIPEGGTTPQIAITSSEELLVCAFKRVVVWERGLVDHDRKQDWGLRRAARHTGQEFCDIIDEFSPDILGYRPPDLLPGANVLSVQLTASESRREIVEQPVHGLTDKVCVLLMNCQSANHEVLRLTRPRLIQVEQVHAVDQVRWGA